MDLPNQPIESPMQPVASPDDLAAMPDISVASPGRPMAYPKRRVVTTLGADVISSLQSLLGTVVIAIFVITFIVQAFQIPSESMENTLLIGDYLLVNKLCYGGLRLGDDLMPYQKIQRGDVIVFHYPVDPQQHFVKRVIGVPGDRLQMVNKKVLINGKPLDEPYVRFVEPTNDRFRDNFPLRDTVDRTLRQNPDWWLEMHKLVEDGQLIIPEGHYFVMGDNRDNSLDSRYWGFVPRENIIGRPLFILWSYDAPTEDWVDFVSVNHIVDLATHLFTRTRWDRTFKLVRGYPVQ